MQTYQSSASPPLPTEVKNRILRYCDRGTLAIASRVTLEFLQLSGPMLYQDITVGDIKQVYKLVRDNRILPSVTPYLSFDQTRSFKLSAATSGKKRSSPFPRLVTGSPVAIDSFIVDVAGEETFGEPLVLVHLASTFDPLRLCFKGAGGPWTRLARDFSIIRWPRLRTIETERPSSEATRSEETYGSRGPGFARRSPLIDLVYDLTKVEVSWSLDFDRDLQSIAYEVGRRGPHAGVLPGFGTVTVRVHNNTERKRAGELLVDLDCLRLDLVCRSSRR